MKITLDSKICEINQGETLLDAVKKLGLDNSSLVSRPLAAQIGGEVFSLRYAPNRDLSVHLLNYKEEAGRRVYERTIQFIFIAAVRRLFPGARVCVRYTLGPGLYITVDKQPALSEQDVLKLESEMRNLVRAALPLERKRLNIKEAIAYYERDGQQDKAELLKWRKFNYFDVYSIGDYKDYFYGEMAPSTDYADVFRLKFNEDALILLLPRNDEPDVPSYYEPQPKFAETFRQSDDWGKLMHCATVGELNSLVSSGKIRELVRVNEALHEKAYANIADQIVARSTRAILVAGPSSSGKTTSAHRLATQLRVLGQDPRLISMDNYYVDRDLCPIDEFGEKDLEHICNLDIPRFSSDLAALMRGEEVEIPVFDFITGKRSKETIPMKLHKDEPIIIEGIHALNPALLGDNIDRDKLFRVYVSALTTLNLDDHNRIHTTDARLLRRLVRDFKTRGADMEYTLSMWQSVRRGEEKWIFPYQENADALFNTTLVYETAVLKKYVYPLLQAVPTESPCYAAARDIIKVLNYYLDADIEDEIPPTSILREFIGGCTFYREDK